MIDAIAQKNSKRAMTLFHDLIILREKPLSILYLLLRHFHLLLQIKEMAAVVFPSFRNNEMTKRRKFFSSKPFISLIYPVSFTALYKRFVVLLFQRDQIALDQDLFFNTKDGYETKVHMGEGIEYPPTYSLASFLFRNKEATE